MKRLLLHIGTGKTGTSSIQNAAFENAAVLRRKADLDYLEHGLIGEDHFGEKIHAHYPVVAWLLALDDRRLRELRGAIDASRASKVLLSCENFYHLLDDAHLARLRALTEGLSVRVIVYIRPQDDYIESAWKQQAKVGALRISFPRFLEKHKDPEHLENSHANYLHMLEPWARHFGDDAIDLRLFDRSAFAGGDLIADFLQACEVPEAVRSAVKRPNHSNVSIPSDLADLARRTNVAGLVPPDEQADYVAFLDGIGGFQDPPLMTAEDRRAVRKNYRTSNRELFLRYRDEKPPVSFMALSIDDASEAEPEKRQPDAAIRCLVELWRRSNG